MRALYALALLVAVANAGEKTQPQATQYQGYRPSPSISAPPTSVASYTVPLNKGQSPLEGNFVDDLFRGSGFGNKGGASPYESSFQGGGGFGQFGGKDVFVSQSFKPSGGRDFDAGGRFQRGHAQIGVLDQVGERSDRNHEQHSRDFSNQDQNAGREDNQERKGQLDEGEWKKQEKKEASKGQKQLENFKQQAGTWNLDSKRQNDKQSHVGSLNKNDGELLRSDVSANDGSKALGVRKTAFINGNLGFENVGYNFDKDFDQKANERGGYKEVTGKDDNNIQIYQEKQRDHRLSNSNNEAFKKADDISRSAKSNKWLQNALQKQNHDNNYGAADKLKDAAAKKAADFKTFFDRRDDKIWNSAMSRDTAYRGAQDKKAKNGHYNKDAIARAAGHKGVADNKFYDGSQSGPGVSGGRPSRGGYVPIGYNAPGINDYAPVQTGKSGKRDVALHQRPIGNTAGIVGPAGTVKGRLEASGGDVRNAHSEKAVQGDLSNQLWNNGAESNAKAKNNYLRDRGLEDSIRTDQANQGKWANQREGFRDGRRQGYNGERAKASRGGEATDKSFADSLSSSNLDAADRGLDKAKLDRINLKRNLVDSNQNVRSKKQFYHDKNQDGYNNEGLNYHRNRGNNDFGAQEAAETEAKTKFNNVHQDSKNSRGQRNFEDKDTRKISNADAAFKRQKADNGNSAAFSLAADRAQSHALGFDRNKARTEFDRFQQVNNQKNKKNWDRANQNIFGRSKGRNVGRRVDGAFQFQNAPFQGSNSGFRSSGDDNPWQLGNSRFGKVSLGKVDGGYTPRAQQRPQPKQTVVNNRHPYDNTGAGIGQTPFRQFW